MFRVSLPNMSKGEIAPELQSRTDVTAYTAGVRKARNVIVKKYGGLSKRPGTRFVTEVADPTQPVRLLPFLYSIEQSYALEMGQGYMRPLALGGVVLEDRLTITAIDRGSLTTVSAALHGYSVGDGVFFAGIEGMTQLNGRQAKVVGVNGTGKFVVDVDSSDFDPFVADTGGITRTEPPAPVVPPVVPPPTPDPEPPVTGGGGGRGMCVAATTTMVLLANDAGDGPGGEILARELCTGMMVWTRHETTLALGAYRVIGCEIADDDTVCTPGYPDATPAHRFWCGTWVSASAIAFGRGRREPVARITVADARTYQSRRVDAAPDAWVLSHNIKMEYQIP